MTDIDIAIWMAGIADDIEAELKHPWRPRDLTGEVEPGVRLPSTRAQRTATLDRP